MGRARGANARMITAFEGAVGTPPADGYFQTPFVSSMLGEERGLIESDLLGMGREPQDPTEDVANNVGDVVVPVDARHFGRWLKLYFGAPTTSQPDAEEEIYSHVFASGALTLPSMAIEIGNPEIPTYAMHYGARGNTLKIAMQRSGLLNATLALIAIGEADPAGATKDGTPTALDVVRFAQAAGSIKKAGVELGNVVSAEFTFSNGLDPVEVIKADGRIADADPGMIAVTGAITVRFADMTLLDAATGQDPIALSFGWARDAFSLLFEVPRVFLPRVKRPVEGPRGIQATFNWQASGAEAASMTATLVNDVTSYA
ncbi:phage tail tube protein [Rhizorhabdus histidinilytica]|uniref:phage tail tube protein n=1 Tax=Rhizorhabdus histidinilytica TaxID=439228 RepID=UPI0004258BE4